MWDYCQYCGKRIEIGEMCYGLPNGGSVCVYCCVPENGLTGITKAKQLTYKEIKTFYEKRLHKGEHGESYYTRLDGEGIHTDVGYFMDCMENGFLPDLQMYMGEVE